MDYIDSRIRTFGITGIFDYGYSSPVRLWYRRFLARVERFESFTLALEYRRERKNKRVHESRHNPTPFAVFRTPISASSFTRQVAGQVAGTSHAFPLFVGRAGPHEVKLVRPLVRPIDS